MTLLNVSVMLLAIATLLRNKEVDKRIDRLETYLMKQEIDKKTDAKEEGK